MIPQLSQPTLSEPVKVRVLPGTGELQGNNGRYEKRLIDLAGLYRDEEAFDAALAADTGAPVYWVESSDTEATVGGLITGISVIEPGRIGEEFAMTRGHIHAAHEFAELYLCLAGHGVMLLETLDGQARAVELGEGEGVYVPGHWVHRSVNVGDERFVTLFCYGSKAGQDYSIIERAGGMKQLIVAVPDGWQAVPNPDHNGYPAA
jgi:glucose-6-phosphate isomerase